VGDRGALRSRELAIAALGLSVALMSVLVGVDALRHHAGAALEAAVAWRLGVADLGAVIVIVVATVDALALSLGARSIVRQVRRQRAFLRRLPVTDIRLLHGTKVSVIADARTHAFCVGLLRPRVFVSTGALRRLDPAELQAVVAHEAEHANRRDPLRLLLVRAVSDAFPCIPTLRRLAAQQASLAELAADAAAVRAVGSRQAVAAALVAFDASGPGEIEPARVDQLAGRAPVRAVPGPLMAAAGGALGGLVVLAIGTLLLPEHFEPDALSAFAPLCSLVVVLPCAWPALLACRRI
jgi:hypothetical protein